jgi:glyoxylase-like metal-dependent hydrolase (beta-lactamase superfamily II)
MKRPALAALAWLAFAATTVTAQTPAESLAPYTARELAPGVHLLATPPDYFADVVSNIVVIEQSDGLVIIDSGRMAADGRRVVGFVRSISQMPVKAVVYTHWHHDHPGGASEIRAAWPEARIISTTQTLAALRGPALRYIGLEPDERFDTQLREEREGLISQIDEQLRSNQHDEATRQRYERMRADSVVRMADIPGTYLVLPTETFRDELLLDDSMRPVRLMFLGRANTDGDAIAWLPNERIVMTGDVVVAPVPFGFFSYPADWMTVLERVKALNYSLLVPGHGEPQTDATYIDNLIASISDLRTQVAPLARQNLTIDEVRSRIDYTRHLEMFGDTPRHRRQLEAFWLRTMTVNAYREARGEPIEQGDEAIYE